VQFIYFFIYFGKVYRSGFLVYSNRCINTKLIRNFLFVTTFFGPWQPSSGGGCGFTLAADFSMYFSFCFVIPTWETYTQRDLE
jgi:hypothetical protein